MKLRTIGTTLAAVGLSLSLVACGDNGDTEADPDNQGTTAEETSSSAPSVEVPSADELNTVLATATNPEATPEERVGTVQGGAEVDPALFDTLIASQEESGAQFQVVDPVLPGYTPESVLATVNFTLPEREPNVAENVEFIWEDEQWKLSQSWACTLVTNTVPPEQVPAMCQDPSMGEDAEAPAEAPAEDEQPADAPAQ